MNPFQIEQKRVELLSLLPNIFGRNRVWHLNDFYSLLIASRDHALFDSYALEFIEDFILSLKEFNSFYQSPQKTKALLQLLGELKNNTSLQRFKNSLDKIQSDIQTNLELLERILDENTPGQIQKNKLCFPLLEEYDGGDNKHIDGIIESVQIKVGKAKHQNNILFIPSGKKVDERLESQTKICFSLALDYLKSFNKKFHSYHEVLIYFDNRSANYEGNSLGIALTIGFIEQLSQLYNLPYLIQINSYAASTGAIDDNGNVLSVSADIIGKKVETVFYSNIKSFIIPKDDEQSALKRYSELKENFPNRRLELIAVNSLADLLNRRNLIEIKKQPIAVRTVKELKRNRHISALIILLISILTFIAIRDFDTNPAITEFQSNHLVVKNKSGKFLFQKELNISGNQHPNEGEKKQLIKLVDINNDGANEVLVCWERFNDNEKTTQYGRICCFNNAGIKIWSYRFNETIKTASETFKDNFVVSMIDTLTENNRKTLYLYANYEMLYPSVIFKVDLQTGKRLDGELWNPGSMYSALIKDLDKDGQYEIIAGCANNALKLPTIFSVKTNKLIGANYSTLDYQFIGQKSSQLENCLFLPKTDYSIYKNAYINMFTPGSLVDNTNENRLMFNVNEGDYNEGAVLVYKLTYDFKNVDIIVNSNLRVRRDSLVAQGKLKMPFTDTKEYTDMLKNQILSWDGNKILKREE